MLFSIDDKYKIEDSPFEIQGKANILYYYDEPMLFNGLNDKGENVIANLCCEDEERDIIRHTYFICRNGEFDRFVNNEICYRQLVDIVGSAYILDVNYEDDSPVSKYLIPVSEINETYLSHYGLFYKNIVAA